MIRKTLPIFAAKKTKNAAYRIDDMFFRFWFRFVFRNQEYIELGRFEELRKYVDRDFDQFSGYALERYFRWKFIEDTSYTRIDAWWDRKGENEIDLVCEDELKNTLFFYEVKRDEKRIDLEKLKTKTVAFFAKNPELQSRKVAYAGLSLKDM